MTSIEKANITQGTKVLVRCDLDVPIENGAILETLRLDRALETLEYIVGKGGFPVIMGHIGKPKGTYEEKLSTKQLLPYFQERLGADNFELLENLRFDHREETNDVNFASELAKKADIYVNESFATSHRKHTSIVEITNHLEAYAGFELIKEVTTLEKIVKSAQKPLIAIIGGAKLESKKPVITKFLQIADNVLVGGKIGLEWTEKIPENLLLPADYATDNKDIGPQTISTFIEKINNSKTIIWAGPMGLFEDSTCEAGTKEIAQAIANNTKNNQVYSVAGGGDTINAIQKLNSLENFSFISTGGSAMLDFIANGTLPGLEALHTNG